MRIVTSLRPLVARQLSPNNSEGQSQDASSIPSITVAFIVMSAVILAAVFFLLYRFRLSRRRKATNVGPSQPLLTLGMRNRSGAMLTQLVEIRRSTPANSTGLRNNSETPEESRPLSVIDIRPPSVIDISPVSAKRGPTRRPAPLSLNTALISNNHSFLRASGLSRSVLFSPMVAQEQHSTPMLSPFDKPLPETPSAFEPTYPPPALQSPGCFVRSEAYSPAILSSTHSSWYNARLDSDSNFSRGAGSSPHPELYARLVASLLPTSVATGGQTSRPGRLVDESNGGGTRALNVMSRENEVDGFPINPWQNPRGIHPQPWFGNAPSKKRPPPRVIHHRFGESLPMNLEITSGSHATALSRSLSTATNHDTPPPPPYTPLDIAFNIPSPPPKARVVSDRTRSPAPHSAASVLPQQGQVPRPLPSINGLQAFLVSEVYSKAPDPSSSGASLLNRRRSNSLPAVPAEDSSSASVPAWNGTYARLETPRFSNFTFEMPESAGGRHWSSSSRRAHKITPSGGIHDTFTIDV